MIELNREQQEKLLKLARTTISNQLDGKGTDLSKIEDRYDDEIFNKKCGAFVTLHIHGKLRGCIGYITGIKSIPETVMDMAIASAFQDPRFPELSRTEFNSIDIEISIMSPIEEVEDVKEIQLGRDGLIVSTGGRSGLLLPQVATENNWNLNQFLENTCYKAGLPGDAWKRENIKIERFSAHVFGEKSLGLA